MVCSEDWEQRQPQDFVRAKADKIAVPWSRPVSSVSYISSAPVTIVLQASSGSGTSADPYVITPTFDVPYPPSEVPPVDPTLVIPPTTPPIVLLVIIPPDGVVPLGPLPLVVELVAGVPVSVIVVPTGTGYDFPTPGGGVDEAWGEVPSGLNSIAVTGEAADTVVTPDGVTTTDLTFTVTYVVTGLPAQGYTVTLTETTGEPVSTPASAVTDTNGEVVFEVSCATSGTFTFIPVIGGLEQVDGEVSVTFATAEFYMIETPTTLIGVDMEGNVALRATLLSSGLRLVTAIPGYAFFFDGTYYYSYSTSNWTQLASQTLLAAGPANPLNFVECMFEVYNSIYIIGQDDTGTTVLRSIDPATLVAGSSTTWTGGVISGAAAGNAHRGGDDAGIGLAEYVWLNSDVVGARIFDAGMTNFTAFGKTFSRQVAQRGLTYGSVYGSVCGVSNTTVVVAVRETLTTNAEVDFYNATSGVFIKTVDLGIPASKFAAIICDASDNILILGETFCFHYLNTGAGTLTNKTTNFSNSTLVPALTVGTATVANQGGAYLITPIVT
tara:strand:+ start:2257 stop:3912 length:1656 start_codon:yes stop_codon:yes gene_type:complete